MCRMADYVRRILSKYMFVRVERPWFKALRAGVREMRRVFSFAPGSEQMRALSVPPRVLTDVEEGQNKALRLAYVGGRLQARRGKVP